MRTATLYSTEQKSVTLYSDNIPYHVRGPIRVINSDDILCKDEISHVHHLPVERWVRNGEEFLIAFDPKLRDIVKCMIQSRLDDNSKYYRALLSKCDDKIKRLQSRAIWDMIKLKFRRKK
jgi:hypothetical protein